MLGRNEKRQGHTRFWWPKHGRRVVHVFTFGQGPWSKLIHDLARAGGKKMGNRVASDSRSVDFGMAKPLKDKIADLRNDSGLCHTYIEKLIDQANSSRYLSSISHYLGDLRKTVNLDRELRMTLLQKLSVKMNTVHKDELMQELLRVMKEKGIDSLLWIPGCSSGDKWGLW
jgi:hypothetical protein